MPISTNLSGAPFFDDYDPTKDFYKVLFQPGVSVQVRELNQLQSILQNQIEKFGDNIFKQGTIIDGCNFSFLDYYPYCKISDTAVNGLSTEPTLYSGLFAKNANNLIAYITDATDGFEITDPNLKTLYLNYVNSGDSGSSTQFAAGDVLTIYSSNNSLFGIIINASSSGFSNSDSVVFNSAISVQVSSGAFSNGDYLVNPLTGANVQIVGVSTNAESNSTILNVKARTTDLANASVTEAAWTFSLFDDVRNASNTVIAKINYIYGYGAKASIITNASGKVTDTILTLPGYDYTILPQVTIQSANNSGGINGLNLTAKNYLAQVTIPTYGSPVGNGYAFAVSDGVIYQKGYFLDVEAQQVIVSKYTQTPNNVSVGFQTDEEIITSNIDSTLLDNALGTKNETAPGADRLKLIPKLVIQDTDIARANSDFLTLVEWNDGLPYKQNQGTQYSTIGKAMAERTSDATGNFVLDTFQVTTDSVANASLESAYYTAVVDPGTAYIDGYKAKTTSNFRIDVKKGTDTKVNADQKVSLNYGNYIRVNQVAGLFQFSTGDTITLYDTAATFLANNTNLNSGIINPVGTSIGTARIRSMVLENGVPGDPTATYRLYLFNIKPNTGQNIKNTKSIYYNGTYKGIADAILELDATTNTNICKLKETSTSGLVFGSGLESIKNSNNTTYTYRTLDQTATFANTGLLVKSVASNPNDFFPYSGSLSMSQMRDFYVVPLANNLVSFNALTGNVSINTTSSALVGNGTTFINDLQAGDYVTIINSGVGSLKKIVSVSNNTYATMDANGAVANTGLLYYRAFPKNVPIPFGTRTGLSANVDANSNILTLNLGMTISGTTTVTTALGVNIQSTGGSSTAKSARRNHMVKIYTGNNVGGTIGPWCLGVPDAFRLRNVYIGNSSVSEASVDVTEQFYIDNNHNVDYADLSYLNLNQKNSLPLANTDYLLVKFDYFVNSGYGYYDTVSYLGTANSAQIAAIDSSNVASLSSAGSSWEVPEMYSSGGLYYDLLNCFDFRPALVNTVATTTSSNTAPLNPAYSVSFGNTADPTNTKKFPLPDAIFTTDVEYYLGRTDSIVIPSNTNITVYSGVPSAVARKRVEPNVPPKSLKLQNISVPAYPNVTTNVNLRVKNLINTRTYNNKFLNERLNKHVIKPTLSANNTALNQPVAPTADFVGNLERRITTLEYYQALTLLETSITNKVIPSTIDGTINRFKYGFFVDDFSTSIYSELTNPQYFASLETANVAISNSLTANTIPQLASNVLVPGKFNFGLKHNLENIHTTYTDFKIIEQTNASIPIPVCSLAPILTTSSTAASVNAYFFAFTGVTGTYTQPMKLAKNIGGKCKFFWTVYFDPFFFVKKNGSFYATTQTARQITADEVAYLKSNPYTNNFFGGTINSGRITRFIDNGGGWVDGSGVFEFDHDPSTGSDYEIGYTNKLGGNFIEYMCIGPIDLTVGSSLVSDPCGAVVSTIYHGTMRMDLSHFSTRTSSYLPITVTGLKPLTTHFFTVSGVNSAASVRQLGKNLGDPLTTDAYGTIALEYYYNAAAYATVGSTQSVPYLDNNLHHSGQWNLINKVIGSVTDDTLINLNIEIKAVASSASGQLVIN